MDKQAQDKIWNELTPEIQKEIQQIYLENIQETHNPENTDELANFLLGKNEMLIDLFGLHNLDPEPQIKTWEDVNKTEDSTDILLINTLEKYPQTPILKKAIATLKIAKLIDLSYGGMVSKEEWKDENLTKFYIPIIPNDNWMYCRPTNYDIHFIAFHTEQQAEEFISHESNRQLVKQYYMM